MRVYEQAPTFGAIPFASRGSAESKRASALFLAKGAHGVDPAGATGGQEAREQGGNHQDGNHDRPGLCLDYSGAGDYTARFARRLRVKSGTPKGMEPPSRYGT